MYSLSRGRILLPLPLPQCPLHWVAASPAPCSTRLPRPGPCSTRLLQRRPRAGYDVSSSQQLRPHPTRAVSHQCAPARYFLGNNFSWDPQAWISGGLPSTAFQQVQPARHHSGLPVIHGATAMCSPLKSGSRPRGPRPWALHGHPGGGLICAISIFVAVLFSFLLTTLSSRQSLVIINKPSY